MLNYLDYAPNGWAAYNDGFPIQTRLTLQFKEMDIVTKRTLREQGKDGSEKDNAAELAAFNKKYGVIPGLFQDNTGSE